MKNAYEVRGDITAIIINSPKYGRLEALISTSKLERAKEFEHRWYATFDKKGNTFYVHSNLPKSTGGGTECLHRWITKAPIDMQVDHKNHNGLDNTDDHLRIATRSENKQNTRSSYNNSKSGIRGVCWKKKLKKWHAQITYEGKVRHLGYFNDVQEAEQAVKQARAKHMPFSKEALAN